MLRLGTTLPTLGCIAIFACAGTFLLHTPKAMAGQQLGWTQPLKDQGIGGDLLSLPYPRNYSVHQVSSYDRTGGPGDDAYGHQVFDGGVVLADVEGPGAILRIYAEDPWGTLLIYVDDMEHPIIARQFEEIFTSELELFSPAFPLFAPPFTGVSSGGHFSYVPIPYTERCRIVVMGDGDALNYQVEYAKFPEGTPIQPFALKLTKEDLEYFRAWRDDWLDYDLKLHDLKEEKLHQSSTIVYPDLNTLVYPIEGPGVITELEFELDSVEPDFTDKFWIAVYFDHQEEPGVLAPIGDFFGRTATASEDASGAVVGMLEGRMWCRYPMPFREFAEIRIINTCDQLADFKYNIIWREEPVQNQHYFFARYQTRPTREGDPYRAADIVGSGHYAGLNLGVEGAEDLSFLEGDDRIRVDGRPAADFHGTATDSYFNAGGYFAAGTFAAPTHACTIKTGSVPARVGAVRTHVTDVVPFDASFVLSFEHGNGNNKPGLHYESVAYWYQAEKNAPLWRIPRRTGVPDLMK